jgi:hypothetical protein
MLHSEILPEHECDGELIELPPCPNHIQTAWCSSCGAEFRYLPDSDSVFIVLWGMRSGSE